MGGISFERFNLNQFYEKTPNTLKYILIIYLIIVGSYFIFSKRTSNKQDKQLAKIEQTIQTTYNLIDRFEKFEAAQYRYNDETMIYLKNIYTLVEELNENTNKKFDLLLKQGGANTEEILHHLILLNESYEKLTKAYTPKTFENQDIKNIRNSQSILSSGSDGAYAIPVDKNGKHVGDTIRLNTNKFEENEW